MEDRYEGLSDEVIDILKNIDSILGTEYNHVSKYQRKTFDLEEDGESTDELRGLEVSEDYNSTTGGESLEPVLENTGNNPRELTDKPRPFEESLPFELEGASGLNREEGDSVPNVTERDDRKVDRSSGVLKGDTLSILQESMTSEFPTLPSKEDLTPDKSFTNSDLPREFRRVGLQNEDEKVYTSHEEYEEDRLNKALTNPKALYDITKEVRKYLGEEDLGNITDNLKEINQRLNLSKKLRNTLFNHLEYKGKMYKNGEVVKRHLSPSKPDTCWVMFDMKIIPDIAHTASIYGLARENKVTTDVSNLGSVSYMTQVNGRPSKTTLSLHQVMFHLKDNKERIKSHLIKGKEELIAGFPQGSFEIVDVNYIPEINAINFSTVSDIRPKMMKEFDEETERVYNEILKHQYLSYLRAYFFQKGSGMKDPRGNRKPILKTNLSKVERGYYDLGFVPVLTIPSCFTGLHWDKFFGELLDSLVKTFKQNGVRFEGKVYNSKGFACPPTYFHGQLQSRFGTYFVNKKYILQLMQEVGFNWTHPSDISSFTVAQMLLKNRGLYVGENPEISIAEGELDEIFTTYRDTTTDLKKNMLKPKGIDIEHYLSTLSSTAESLTDEEGEDFTFKSIDNIHDLDFDSDLDLLGGE